MVIKKNDFSFFPNAKTKRHLAKMDDKYSQFFLIIICNYIIFAKLNEKV